ncbi:ABC transporter substrate-binding protein [Marinomonas sp.]|nr:ABC transporter substrate-binding protein [Marinomonas sp.]
MSNVNYALTIQTFRGEVEFNKTPQTVVAFPAGVIDTLDALGVAIQGVPANLFLDYVDVKKAETVGTLFTVDVEKVHKITPDIVIIGERSALQYDSLIDVAPVIDLSIPRGNTFQESLKRMHSLAKLFNKENKAREIEQSLYKLLNQAQSLIDPNESVMVVMLIGRSLNVLSSQTRIDWFQQELGMNLEASDVTSLNEVAPISYEYILSKNPDWLIVMDRDASVGRSKKDLSKEYMNTPLIHATKAWKNDQVIYLNGIGTLNSVGGVQGIQRTLEELITVFSDHLDSK